jgi:hypothetical protein
MPSHVLAEVGRLNSQICRHRPGEVEHEIWIVVSTVAKGTAVESLLFEMVVMAGLLLVFATAVGLEQDLFDWSK